MNQSGLDMCKYMCLCHSGSVAKQDSITGLNFIDISLSKSEMPRAKPGIKPGANKTHSDSSQRHSMNRQETRDTYGLNTL